MPPSPTPINRTPPQNSAPSPVSPHPRRSPMSPLDCSRIAAKPPMPSLAILRVPLRAIAPRPPFSILGSTDSPKSILHSSFSILHLSFAASATTIRHPQPPASSNSCISHNLQLPKPKLYTWSGAHVSRRRAPRLIAIFPFSSRPIRDFPWKTAHPPPKWCAPARTKRDTGGIYRGLYCSAPGN